MIAEAIMIWCIYVMPFIVVITILGFIFETVIPAIAKRKARKRREQYYRGLK